MSRTSLSCIAVAFVCVSSGSDCPAGGTVPPPIHSRGLSVPSPPVIFAMGDSICLTQLATLELSFGYGMAFGDSDHDGATELAFTGQMNSYRIWEHKGDNVYSIEASGISDLITYAMADTDQDGRSEIIGQTSGYVQVWESIDATSHPSLLVWSSPYLSNVVGYTAIGDSDRDGHLEIIQSVNGGGSASGLVIFENTGNDMFTSVFSATLTGPSSTGEKLVADLDGDDRTEIALCGDRGWLHVFESPSDNVWVLTSRIWTGLFNAYTVDGGQDTDGNGKPEIFVMGTLFTDSTASYSTVIYESAVDDSLVRVTSIVMDQGIGAGSNALCNIDAAGSVEYLMRTSGIGIRIFRSCTPGIWNLIGTAYGPGGGISVYDLNQNGITEVVWEYTTVRIFEHPGTTTDPSFDSSLRPLALDLAPNPCRAQATLRLSHPEEGVARLAVFDMRGRLVERRAVDVAGGPILWQPRGLPAGVYLVRLEDKRGRIVASGRGTIVH